MSLIQKTTQRILNGMWRDEFKEFARQIESFCLTQQVDVDLLRSMFNMYLDLVYDESKKGRC